MIYNRKSTFILIDGQHLFVNDAQLNTSVSLTPKYLEGQRNSFDYCPNSIEGSLRLSYFITGQDILKNKLSDEAIGISGNINGIYFTSGFINSYSVDIIPNEPLKASAELVIFNTFTGDYVSENIRSPNLTALNGSDVTFTNLYTNTPIDIIYSASYNYSAEINPVFFQQTGSGLLDIFPDRVAINKKEVKLTLECDSLDTRLPIYGQLAAIRISAKDADGVEQEAFAVSGKINKKAYNFSQDTRQQLDIIQHRISEVPQISSFYPTSASALDMVTINGTNFKNVLGIYVNNEQVSNYSVINPYQINFQLPESVNSGYVSLVTFEENAISSTQLNITYPNISVSEFSPTTLVSGNSIIINGTNFYKISNVLFDNVPASQFSIVNPNYINAVVPGRILNGKINVISSSRNISGQSSNNYVAYPVIDSFYPFTGFLAETVTVLGANLTGIQSVTVNGINALYTGITTGELKLTIPQGNSFGFITINTDDGLSVNSPYKFEPVISVTGLSLKSGIAFSSLNISGRNFYSDLLYPITNDLGQTYYKVSFNGISTGFYLTSATLLTGSVPRGANSGPVYIYKNDGASTYSVTGNFTYINDAAQISFSTPSGIISGDSLSLFLVGNNLTNLNKLYFTGVNTGSASGYGIIVWDRNYSVINPPADTKTTRRLNTSGQNDLFGLASTFKHNFNTNISLSGNAILSGLAVRTGIYNMVVENAGGTGYSSGSFNIYPLTNLAQLDSTKLIASEYPSGDSVTFSMEKATDDNATTYGLTNEGIKSYLKLAFTSTCQIFDIEITTGPYTYPSMSTGYLEISLITGNPTGAVGGITGIASSGICTGLAYSVIKSGFYGLNTGTTSWRNEANAILIRSHRINATGQYPYPLGISNIKVLGIKMSRTGSV